MIDRAHVRDALTCPIASLHLPFTQTGDIDFDGMRHLIDFTIAAGTKTVLLTAGDSQYTILTDQEVAEVTKSVVDHTAGRAMVVAADRSWGIQKEVEFARYARDVGADVLMVKPPAGAPVCTVESLVEYYAAVAGHIPVMLVNNVFRNAETFGLQVMERLRDTVEGIVAVKDDVGGPFARKMCLLVHEQWATFAGGLKQTHLNIFPYGCDGYMATFIKFEPRITHEYWSAAQSGDVARMVEIIKTYDAPYFDFIDGLPGGRPAGFYGTLELFGIAGRWRRSPFHNLSDEEMERLADFFKQKGLL